MLVIVLFRTFHPLPVRYRFLGNHPRSPSFTMMTTTTDCTPVLLPLLSHSRLSATFAPCAIALHFFPAAPPRRGLKRIRCYPLRASENHNSRTKPFLRLRASFYKWIWMPWTELDKIAKAEDNSEMKFYHLFVKYFSVYKI